MALRSAEASRKIDIYFNLIGRLLRRPVRLYQQTGWKRRIQEPDSKPENQLFITEEQADGQFTFCQGRCNIPTYQNIQPLPKLMGISVKVKCVGVLVTN